MRRVLITALLLFLGIGGLCAAWYVSTQRAFDAEVTLRSQQGVRLAGDRERVIASSLAERLETLRRTESQRPYFHYQNLYHDPKGASQGLSVTPSPLANGPVHPLVVAHFQFDAQNRVTLPTLNEELRELNAPDAVKQRELRSVLAQSLGEMREAASSLRAQVESEAKAARATATRIAELEKRLADAQQAERQREEFRRAEVEALRAETRRREAQRAEVARLENEKATLQRNDQQRRMSNQSQMPAPRSDEVAGQNVIQVQSIDPSAFQQNANSNVVYQQVKQNQPLPPIVRTPASAPPVEILTSDFEWRTVQIGGTPRLVALRAVHTPTGTLTQGMLTAIAEGASLDGVVVRRKGGSSVEGTGWRVRLPADGVSSPAEERRRFLRMFVGVSSVLMLVILGVVWTVWRAEKLATDRTRFAATAAHELRTPLASLRLYSDLIAEEDDPANRERYARELASQTERLGRVVANVLEVTRIERGAFTLHPRPGEIGVAVEECIDRLRPQLEAADCPIHLRVAENLPNIAFDADAIHHVVDNLVDNAEKYSRDVPHRSISVDVTPDEGGVAITVSDRGPGVAEELVRDPRAFRRGASAMAPAGLGLGLFLVHRIVQGHGGAIRAKSGEGGGASVRVFLPAFTNLRRTTRATRCTLMIMKNRMIIALLAGTMLVVRTARPDDVSTLRAGGQLAVDDLHAQWTSTAPDARAALSTTLDRVCAQKDCHASRLFWHTDLEQAKAEAERLGRPILSLHLLGRLDEELSCANSRFFRTLLYSDESISALLRDGFVLHWHSVREVPRVTIELGDGRVIRQTIAGNSAHYLLDANGSPLDVLPGLYSAAAFRDQLERWVTLHRTLTPETLLAYHRERFRLTSARAVELGIDGTRYPGQQPAWNAQRQAQSKAMTEVRVLRQVKRGERAIGRQMEQLFAIGEQGKQDVQFSESTLQLMRSKQELTAQVLDNLRRTVASDTAFNEYELHRRAHAWFVGGEVGDLHSLNERVYDELFLTPSSDPWLGLQPESVFTGIGGS